jgi:hypothetical protein
LPVSGSPCATVADISGKPVGRSSGKFIPMSFFCG